MSALDRLIARPRLAEISHVDLVAPPAEVWARIRHAELGQSTFARALFALRTLPDRIARRATEPPRLRLADLTSSATEPGFQILVDDPPREVAVGAIGKVWQPTIPFAHVANAEAFGAFADPGWVRVAWALRVVPRGDGTRLEVEVRVDATDDVSWKKFRRYFRLIGPFSRLIRRGLLASYAKELEAPEAVENTRPLPGDELLPDGRGQTHSITIGATPAQIWPWLVQLGCRRGGFYSIDLLDNGNTPSAREIHPELQVLAVGQVIAATPKGNDGFEVLHIEPRRALVLGGLFDPIARKQLRFATPRPAEYWQATWAFYLEPLDAETTRLHARVRAAYSRGQRAHAWWIAPVHAVMQRVQLRNLAARAEGRFARTGWRDVVAGIAGASRMALDFVTPRRARRHWGLSEHAASLAYPGDTLVSEPRWGWTHAVEIAAPAESVWPWIAQLGADRAGFYSYQWLENLAGCDLRNAETIHPEWQLREGDELSLHPDMPPLRVVELRAGRHLIAFAAPVPEPGKPWVAASWLFLVQPLGAERCRLISRYRVATSEDLRTRAAFGELTIEPIGFAMDRRMLLGIKERAERTEDSATSDRRPPPRAARRGSA